MANELFLKTTIREILASFSHAVEEKTGRPFSDFKWPNRLMYFHLINQRAEIIYQTRKQNQLEGNYEDYTEVLPCVEMKEVDMVECPCMPPSHCTFMKCTTPLPRFIGGDPTLVTTVNGFEKYNYVDWSMFKHRINNRNEASNQANLFTLQTIENERWLYTYITKEKGGIPIKARSTKVSGVPIDPMEMFMYPICGKIKKEPCDILNLNFVIEKRLTNILFDATHRKLISINKGTTIGDTQNDDRNAEAAPDKRF